MDNPIKLRDTMTGLITKGVNVPTSLSRLKEPKIKGHAWFVVVAWGILFIISGTVSMALICLHAPPIPSIIVPGAFFAFIAFKKAKDRQQVLKLYHNVCLFIRMFRKNSALKKYKMSLDDLKKWIPVESIEDSGLIRYSNGTSAAAIALDPPRNSAKELELYNERLNNLINTLYGEYSYQFYTISAQEITNFLEKSTAAVLNQDIHPSIADHMYSVYEYATDKSNIVDIPDWNFLLFVTFPKTGTIEDAEHIKTTFVSGLSKELKRAQILSNVINDRTACIVLLRLILTGRG